MARIFLSREQIIDLFIYAGDEVTTEQTGLRAATGAGQSTANHATIAANTILATRTVAFWFKVDASSVLAVDECFFRGGATSGLIQGLSGGNFHYYNGSGFCSLGAAGAGWHHWVVVSTPELFAWRTEMLNKALQTMICKDGVEVGSSAQVIDGGANLYLGVYLDAHGAEVSYNAAGAFRDVALWSTARTAEEIASDMTKRFSSSESGLLGWWQLNEAGGQSPGNQVSGSDASMTLAGGATLGASTSGYAGNSVGVLLVVGGDDVLDDGSGADTHDGGAGSDTVDYSATETQARAQNGVGVEMNLALGQANKSYKAGYDDVLRRLRAGDGSTLTAQVIVPSGALQVGEGYCVGKAYRLTFQGDGNLVIYDTAGKALWASDTWNASGGELRLGSDRSLAVAAVSVRDTLLSIENLEGTAQADSLVGSANPNQLVGGAGDDTLDGGTGDDNYFFGRGDGRDKITDSGRFGNVDVLQFININQTNLWLSRVGFDLQISAMGSNEQVTVKDWYLGGATDLANQIERIKTADGMTMYNDVERLVQAMAAVTPPAATQTSWASGQTSNGQVLMAVTQ